VPELLRQNHRRGDDRSGQRAASSFVNARDPYMASRTQFAFEPQATGHGSGEKLAA
jgi:hypothetical protein